jgi:DNA-binding CsgD family transcriptional regulator
MVAVINSWRAYEAGSSLPEPPLVALPGFVPAATEAAALHHLSLGEHPEAVAAFDAAAAAWWTGSDRRAAIRCRWGAALAADLSGAPDALDRMQRCWRDAVDHGSAPVAARAGRALRQRRVHTTPFPAPALAPLSASESQVLRLVAAGFTTEEVSTALGVHCSTVGDHLHAAVARLGLRHRAEAVRWITAQP